MAEGVIAALNYGKGLEEIDKNIALLSSAVEKGDKFIKYARSESTSYDSWRIDVGNIMTGVMDWLSDRWKDKALIKQLEGLKIASFEEIEMRGK